jgi:hypothetical protein
MNMDTEMKRINDQIAQAARSAETFASSSANGPIQLTPLEQLMADVKYLKEHVGQIDDRLQMRE